MNTRRVTIGQPNTPLRAILEVEGNTRVVAVLLPNGSPMPYKDIPQWVFMDIRHRGMVYVGDALLETQMPQQTPPIHSPSPQGTWHKNCKPACVVAASVIGLFAIIGIFVPDTPDDDSTSPVVAGSPTRIPRVIPTSTPRSTPTPLPTPTPTPPTYISVGEILSTFRANPARGKVQYMGESVYVKGKVRAFNDSDSRVVYLTPDATWETEDYEVFLVRLATLQQAASLSRGDEISMLCKISSGYAFPHGHEIECTPVGTVSIPPTPTPSPIPTQTPIPTPTALSASLPAGAATVQAVPTATIATQPASTPTFDERRQTVIDQYCGGSGYAQACVDKVGDEYCVEFYENPTQYYTRYGACTFFGF